MKTKSEGIIALEDLNVKGIKKTTVSSTGSNAGGDEQKAVRVKRNVSSSKKPEINNESYL